jgi:hypothetical protein
MKSTLAKLLLGALIVTIAAPSVFGADKSLGTWKLNMEKSKFSPTPILKSLTTTREASGGGVKVTSTGQQADGTPINASYTAKYDGSDTSVTGAPWDTMALKQVNDHTFTSTAKKTDGKYRSTSRIVISADGKTMTTTVKGTNAEGKAFNNTMVYDKQ